MGAWRADYYEQRALAVHHFEGAYYLVVVFGVLPLNNTWGPEVICRGCLLCRMQECLAVSHDCFRVVPTLIEALGYALFQEGFGVVPRPISSVLGEVSHWAVGHSLEVHEGRDAEPNLKATEPNR